MSRRSPSILLVPVVLAACSSDPEVPVAPGSSSDDGATSTGTVDPDGDPSTGPESGGTTEHPSQTDGTTFAATDTGASTTSPGDTSTGDTDTEGTSTDTGEPSPFCGDGNVDAAAGEQCDDAGESAACNVDCTAAVCGDGLFNALAGEACDDGGESALCNFDCTPAACGDGLFNATSGEACDDGGGSAACNADCTLASCGDGIVNALAGEACDDGGESATCNADCTAAACGDGITNALAGEACDDGGESLTCDADCTAAACGDGIVNALAGEACDDAGLSAACDADCTAAVCGDGQLNALAGEACDGPVPPGESCQTLGYLVGTLACDAGCSYDTTACANPPDPPVLALGFSQIKQLDFTWAAVPGADHYQLLESAALGDPYVQLGGDLVGTSASFEMPLHFRTGASYVLRACNAAGCTDSAPVPVANSMAAAVGYVKASNTDPGDWFGRTVAISDDGNTLAIGAPGERSGADGIDGDQNDDGSASAGAVYVFVRDAMGQWTQAAYVKASNSDPGDGFGASLALSDDGSTLVVGAPYEDNLFTGVNPFLQDIELAQNSGATYVFTRDGAGTWSQQAYIKASNTGAEDYFGYAVTVAGDGNTLAVGAIWEDSNATGINGDQANNSASYAGAAYVFVRSGGAWSQQAYVKASNTNASDYYGASLALDDDGNTLVVSGSWESSAATGVGGNQADNSAQLAGAVYAYTRSGGGVWSQQAYIKASNTEAYDRFGLSLALSGDGNTMVAGAFAENSGATGVNGNQALGSVTLAGAAYVFVRDGVGAWSQQAYVKASNTAAEDRFGDTVALSDDGNVLAVSSYYEDGSSTGLDGDQADNAAASAGAVYVLARDGAGVWSQRAYVKASNTGAGDQLGYGVALSEHGDVLAVGAFAESSNATGVSGDQGNDAAGGSGAVYLY